MFGFNPYAMIGGAVAALALVGSFAYQNHEIHKYHTQLECVRDGTSCPKNFKGETIPDLETQIEMILATQKHQTQTTAENVTKVVKVPVETTKVITEIKKVPVSKECVVPDYPQDVKDSY